MRRNFSEELDKNDVNYYELVNVTAQAARMINDQVKIEGKELKNKVTTEALAKVMDGRVVTIKEDEVS
jgi:DNA-directed RNA polymerase subunit K/omega